MLREYITKDGKKLRLGYTTGSCAAAASKAAAIMLLTQEKVESVRLTTPKGINITVEIEDIEIYAKHAKCAVRKDSGDDIDATRDMLIYSEVTLMDEDKIIIDGGPGIGRVTMKGLNQPVGAAAINSVPRDMIVAELQNVCETYAYKGGFSVTISAPAGKAVAEKTFNPNLGIIGGISILGTTGIVEPMSESAIIDTIKAELDVKRAQGKDYVVITPGNYGEEFLSEKLNKLSTAAVKCSNFIGDTLDYINKCGFKGVLLVGHIGKIVKLAGGLFNTHSKFGDCRAEIIASHSILCGADLDIAKRLLASVTTDDMLDILDEAGLIQQVINNIMKKIYANVNKRVFNECKVAVMTFSSKSGMLGYTENTDELIENLELGDSFERSKLYDPNFETEFRKL